MVQLKKSSGNRDFHLISNWQTNFSYPKPLLPTDCLILQKIGHLIKPYDFFIDENWFGESKDESGTCVTTIEY